MDGHYVAHRVLCLGCQAVHLHTEEHGPIKPAERVFVLDDDPGYVPDARMMPTR